jgi:hypothetical protein
LSAPSAGVRIGGTQAPGKLADRVGRGPTQNR